MVSMPNHNLLTFNSNGEHAELQLSTLQTYQRKYKNLLTTKPPKIITKDTNQCQVNFINFMNFTN